MTFDPDESESEMSTSEASLFGSVMKPVVLATALLVSPAGVIAVASPILVPMLFGMSRRDSVDRGWQRAGLVGAGVTVVITALFLLASLGTS